MNQEPSEKELDDFFVSNTETIKENARLKRSERDAKAARPDRQFSFIFNGSYMAKEPLLADITFNVILQRKSGEYTVVKLEIDDDGENFFHDTNLDYSKWLESVVSYLEENADQVIEHEAIGVVESSIIYEAEIVVPVEVVEPDDFMKELRKLK